MEFPKSLKDYELIQENIGVGGFAVVHKAKCQRGVVALKVPKDTLTDETVEVGSFDKFLEEAQIWQKLSRRKAPGVVRLYSYGKFPYPWMAMEYMPGGTLQVRIKELSSDDSVRVIAQILDALHYAHHVGVIHRDIKPQNILFSKDGSAKLTDWGLGKILLDMGTTATSTFKGTVRYSAPEQYDPDQEVDWHTDIYQTGAVLYHLLAKRPPVPNDLFKAMNIVTQGKIEPLHNVNPKIDKNLSRTIMKALSVRKEDRWDDAKLFLKALQSNTDVIVIQRSANVDWESEEPIIPRSVINTLDKIGKKYKSSNISSSLSKVVQAAKNEVLSSSGNEPVAIAQCYNCNGDVPIYTARRPLVITCPSCGVKVQLD